MDAGLSRQPSVFLVADGRTIGRLDRGWRGYKLGILLELGDLLGGEMEMGALFGIFQACLRASGPRFQFVEF